MLMIASMRPRVFPAEDPALVAATPSRDGGFNEAAGIPRGRLYHGTPRIRVHTASMRPRVFPAEDCIAHCVHVR